VTAVFVHGVPETSELWDDTRGRLGVDSVALALPGFGSMRPGGFGATKDDYAEWLVGALGQVEQPIDLVGHDWGSLLCLRVVTAFDVPVRSWAIDMARAFHPDYVWNRVARACQTPGAGEEWLRAAREADPENPASTTQRLILLGVPRSRAESMAAAHDETMSRCILDLYRSATPNVSADWGAALTGHTRAPGLVLLPSADPFNDEVLSRAIAGQLGARTQRLDGLGHSWMVEDPKATAHALRRFWSSIATG
jgi:pimeloyl-ACP methyl ester carboxylesterase